MESYPKTLKTMMNHFGTKQISQRDLLDAMMSDEMGGKYMHEAVWATCAWLLLGKLKVVQQSQSNDPLDAIVQFT